MTRIHPINSHCKNKHSGKISLWLAIPLGTVALLLLGYFLFANTILKNVTASAIGNAAGAEANIGDFDHSIFPFGIELTNIQVTDNAAPTTNKISADMLAANVALMPLLSGKVIIDDLVAQNIAFGNKRIYPGEVYKQVDTPSSFAFPTLEDLPSVDEILASSPLKTTAAIEQAQTVYNKYHQPLEKQYKTLPTKESIDAYKERIKALQKVDFKNPAKIANAATELKKLKDEIQQEREKVSAFVSLAKEAKQAANASVAALKSAPQEDYALLQGLVAGEEGAIGQVTQHLFGEQAEIYTKALVTAADMLLNSAPTNAEIETEQDKVDSYPELPNIWIKNADISLKWLDESLATTWSNITDQHDKVGAPTLFDIKSLQATNWQEFTLNGKFEILKGTVNSEQRWNIQNAVLKDLTLIPEEAKQTLNAVLNSGLLSGSGNLNINANQLSGSSVFNLKDLNIAAQGKNDLTNTIASVIDTQQSMRLNGVFSGTLSRPSISVKSDLDTNLLKTLGANLKNNPKLTELKQKLNAKAASQLGSSSEQLNLIDDLLSAAQGDNKALSDLLEAQVVDKKDAILDKLQKKLFN